MVNHEDERWKYRLLKSNQETLINISLQRSFIFVIKAFFSIYLYV
nr:MAG TPA: hypothetical protein [Caudoviricetes sp.]